ncbi:MAG: hypothetical protein J6W52_12045 [Bacteroidaceae bacterium]|nr:hypothetical protein [Bacteroidaceae bacterium]
MNYNRISTLALCLSAFSLMAMAQNVTLHKQGGVGQVYKVEQVDSVVYFPIGDAEQFPASEEENTTTLWDVIKAQPNLKKFTAILEAASYYTDKDKAAYDLQFSQLLGGNVPLTVYAPTDAAISEDRYAELLALAKTDGWKLQQEFVFNHISARESKTPGNVGVKMLNGKIIGTDTYDVTVVNQECNNGRLCTVPSCFPYLPNMMDYLLNLAPDCTLAQEFMNAFTERTFDANKSISVPAKDGYMLTLDSVFSSRNRLMDPYLVNDDVTCIKGFGVNLADENANYDMVMPTDQVWNDAHAKLSLLSKYPSKYEDKVMGDINNGLATIRTIDNPDSNSALSLGTDILVSLLGRTASGQETRLSNGTAYTEVSWPVPISEYKPDVEVNVTKNAFYATSNTSSYYKVGYGAALYDVSLPSSQSITDRYGNVCNGDFFYIPGISLNSNPHVEIKLVGEKGEQVMSGKYDVQVVMVPYWYVWMGIPKGLREATTVRYTYNDSGEVVKADTITYYPEIDRDGEFSKEDYLEYAISGADSLKDEHYVDSVSAISKMSLIAQVRHSNNASNGKDVTSMKSSIIEYDGSKVDTITVLEDFEFPYSYKNIPNSYPTLILEGATKSATQKQGFMYGLCIDKVILKSKEDGSETIVTP